MKIRVPAVAGYFYPADEESLRRSIEESFRSHLGPGELPKRVEGPRSIIGLVSPHAGYVYSGPVAAHGYYQLASDGRPDVFVILGPNHTGLGSGVSIMTSGEWRTPLGGAVIDEELAEEISEISDIIDVDEEAHRYEHSIEVQLPFLQYLYGEVTFVPICMMMQDLRTAREVGRAISEALRGRDAVIIASSDMTHYESRASAEYKDQESIRAIISLDEELLYDTISRLNVSMCGPGPVAATLTAVKKLGKCEAKLLKYATSGDVTGDYSSVVGYASISMSLLKGSSRSGTR